MTSIINIKSGDKYDVYCGRAGHGKDGYFGNPFIIGKDGNRQEVIDKYRAYFLIRIQTDKEFKRKILELKNKVLGCFCKQKNKEVLCHCDIIVEYLDNLPHWVLKCVNIPI